MAKRKALPEDVTKAVDELIQQYIETGDVKNLTDFSLMSKLGISSRTLDAYYEREADKRLLEDDKLSQTEREKYTKYGYYEAVKRLIEFRRGECVSHIASGGASTTITGWIFLSKQPRWGGFQDVQRVEKSGVQTFNIQLADSGGKALRSE